MIGERRAHLAAENAAREGYGKLLAYLTARCGDLHAAEDALADAFSSALERWPARGVPDSPEAWLAVAARNSLTDRARAWQRSERLADRVLNERAAAVEAVAECDHELVDDRLAMMFACAHPALPPAIHGPLILQAVLGLSAEKIASAFLIAPATMSQRLVRAKKKMAATRIPLRVPAPAELPQRLDSVLAAVYAAFATGWDDPAGHDPRNSDLAEEALWLGRLIVELCPTEPEPRGLLALMLHAHARRPARRAPGGSFVALDDQDVSLWSKDAIDEAERLIREAAAFGRPGRFQLEAAIQSAHAVRRFGCTPHWDSVVTLYDALHAITGSPVVALNRAIAIGRAHGAEAGLAALPPAAAGSPLFDYQPYWAARAALCAQAGALTDADAAYAKAIGLAVDPSARDYLSRKRAALSP